uniref:Kazal-like domain-containing protein n=1 Tax=Magallana gigas TaxID=29159 RepID=A0A8W8N0W2_MAGGI
MNLLTVACVILSLSFGLEARQYSNFPGPNPGHGLRPCPNILCPAVFIEPECRKDVITSFSGFRCLGCPKNVCINNNGYPRPGPGGYEG